MNKNMENIIRAYSAITNNHDKANIISTLSASEIFNEIANNNPTYLYEGYPSNLLEIVEELKANADCPAEIHKITEESIMQYNKKQRTIALSRKTSIPIIVTAAKTSERIRPFGFGSRTIAASATRSSAVVETIGETKKHPPVVKGAMIAAKQKTSSKAKTHYEKKRTTT